MKKIYFEENRLYMDGKEISFKYDIREFIVINDSIIVRLSVRRRDDDINNIYCVRNGKIAWRVQDILEYDPGYEIFGPDPYSGIDVYEGNPNLAVGTTGEGYRFVIDPKNGNIVERDGWVK